MSDSLWNRYWRVWKKTFVYQGKASRREFWSFILITIIFYTIFATGYFYWSIFQVKYHFGTEAVYWLLSFYVLWGIVVPLILLLPTVAVGIRRMHDIGYSGWWFGGALLFIAFILPTLNDKNSSQIGENHVVSLLILALSVIIAIYPFWLCCKKSTTKDLP